VSCSHATAANLPKCAEYRFARLKQSLSHPATAANHPFIRGVPKKHADIGAQIGVFSASRLHCATSSKAHVWTQHQQAVNQNRDKNSVVEILPDSPNAAPRASDGSERDR
jgi:hypothetical protein